jgi:hypothetical protein
MENRSSLKATRVEEKSVEEGRVEVFNISIFLSQEDEEKFKSDPHEFMKELMERNGLKVNGISGDKTELMKYVEGHTDASFEWLHYVYPESKRSNWSYHYLD